MKSDRNHRDAERDDQERAIEEERVGAAPGPRAEVRAYRVVVRALARPVVPDLPSNFAWYVAELARAAAGEWGARDRLFRRRLLTGVFALLSVVALLLIVAYGPEWAVAPSVRSDREWIWLAAIGASVGVGRLVERFLRSRAR